MSGEIKPSDVPRQQTLALLVADSGRTWCVLYSQITRIPPEAILRGDVFIVRRESKPGVMFMQVTEPHGTAWKLEAIDLRELDS